MGVRISITPPAPTSLVIADRDALVEAAQRTWPGLRVVLRDVNDPHPDAYLYPRIGEREVEVSHYPDNQHLSCDGPVEDPAVASVIAWIRSLNPDPRLTLWAVDAMGGNYAVLTPGMSPTDIQNAWTSLAPPGGGGGICSTQR